MRLHYSYSSLWVRSPSILFELTTISLYLLVDYTNQIPLEWSSILLLFFERV